MAYFDCEIVQIIHATDGTAVGTRKLGLPFAPYPGLNLLGIFGRDDEGEPIARVTWDEDRCVFVLAVEDDHAGRDMGETMAEAKTIYDGRFAWEDHPYREPAAATA